jgi:hypothetical protein
MAVKRHIGNIKSSLESVISNSKHKLATASLALGMAIGTAGIVQAQETQNPDYNNTLNSTRRQTLYQEIIPNGYDTEINLNTKKSLGSEHRIFVSYPSYQNFIDDYNAGIIRGSSITNYGIDAEVMRLIEESAYPKTGTVDPCGCSQNIASMLSTFLNNKDPIQYIVKNGERVINAEEYIVGNLTPAEKKQLSQLVGSYGYENFLIGIVQNDEPFKEILPNGIKEYYPAERTPGFLLIRGEGSKCAEKEYNTPKTKNTGLCELYLGPDITYLSDIEKYVPGKIIPMNDFVGVIPGATAGLRIKPIIIGLNIGGRKYNSTDFESFPCTDANGIVFGGTDFNKNIKSDIFIYGGNLGIELIGDFTVNVGIQKTRVKNYITGKGTQWVTDRAGDYRDSGDLPPHITDPNGDGIYELTPEQKIDEFYSKRFGIGYNGDRVGINGGVVVRDRKIDGIYGNLVFYIFGNKRFRKDDCIECY